MNRIHLSILCVGLALSIPALAQDESLPYSSILPLVIEIPSDALRIRVVETETVGQKLEHFQAEVAKLSENGGTLPIFVAPRAANRIVPGEPRGEDDKILEIQLRKISVRDAIIYFCEVLGLKWEFINQGLLIKE